MNFVSGEMKYLVAPGMNFVHVHYNILKGTGYQSGKSEINSNWNNGALY